MMNTDDITGKKFGMLTAIQPTDLRTSNGEVVWKFKCDCGNEKLLPKSRVKRLNTKSCGCLRKKNTNFKYNTEPNKVRFENDLAILTTNGQYQVEFIIDKEDYDKIKDYKWYLNPQNYIIANSDKEVLSKSGREYKPKVYLHRLILWHNQEHTDHINGNPLDNRKSNLRACSISQNFGNRKPHKTYRGKETTSQYKGVTKRGDKWAAQLNFRGKYFLMGSFETETEAAKAYNDKAKEVFGDFCNLNKV